MKLEYELELKKENEFKSLYSWFISEIGQEGDLDSGHSEKYIPYPWSVNFQIKNIHYQTEIQLENETNELDLETNKYFKLGESYKIERSERISGSLRINDNNYFSSTKLSMFGTNRHIENINLTVYKIKDEFYKVRQEYCRITGFPGFSTEIDFRNETVPDFIEIHLGLKEDEYQNIVERIKDKSINSYLIALRDVRGFYSPWSPEISTSEIKVLTRTHEINIHEDALPDDYELPRLGNVGNFSMTSRFAYELIKEDNIEQNDIDESIESVVPLSASERIQQETKEELSKLLSLAEKQQKHVYLGFIFLIITILITSI